MDPKLPSILPFISLNEMMNDEYRDVVVKRVLNFRQDPKHKFQKDLEQAIRKRVRVKGGFLDPLKAPSGMLIKEVIKEAKYQDDIMGNILRVWVISQSDLAEKVRTFLTNKGVRVSDFKNGWDGFLENIDSKEMIEEANDFLKENPNFDFDDAALMICCQQWGASRVDEPRKLKIRGHHNGFWKSVGKGSAIRDCAEKK